MEAKPSVTKNDSSSFLNKNTEKSDAITPEPEDPTLASPAIWVPLSLLVACIYAISNTTISVIAHYRIKARFLQSPGSIVGNGVALALTAYYEKYYGYLDYDNSKHLQPHDISYFKWFYDIYLYEVSDLTDAENNSKILKVHWYRVLISVILGITMVCQNYLQFVSYDFASMAHLNNGVLMSIFAVRPILLSILFFILFNQTLKSFEIVGIGL